MTRYIAIRGKALLDRACESINSVAGTTDIFLSSGPTVRQSFMRLVPGGGESAHKSVGGLPLTIRQFSNACATNALIMRR